MTHCCHKSYRILFIYTKGIEPFISHILSITISLIFTCRTSKFYTQNHYKVYIYIEEEIIKYLIKNKQNTW